MAMMTRMTRVINVSIDISNVPGID
ncbi:uncharacterized protein METZ01_LOCUS60993 [marine metagenome]|uniref:Uncharacterized protein n=1 Tax=marine metagenome TaxID=408172 RepID=A0A381SXG6_9ZZZZ